MNGVKLDVCVFLGDGSGLKPEENSTGFQVIQYTHRYTHRSWGRRKHETSNKLTWSKNRQQGLILYNMQLHCSEEIHEVSCKKIQYFSSSQEQWESMKRSETGC